MPVFLLSILGFGKSLLTGTVTWLSRRSMAELGCIALGIAVVILLLANRAEKHHSTKLQNQLTTCATGRQADRAAYVKAQADAGAKNVAVVAHVQQQQQEVSDETVALLNSHIARLRVELQHPTGAPKGTANKPDLPASGQTATGANGPSGVCLSPAELLSAAESEERHDRLIDWVERQSEIDPNKDQPTPPSPPTTQ